MSTLALTTEQRRAQAAEPTGADILAPHGQYYATAFAAWAVANLALFMRLHVPVRKSYRWVNLRVGTQSGNIQVGLVRLTRSGTTVTGTLVASSGIVACPASGDARVDLGTSANNLPAGDYALFLWCDNTTATFLHGLITGFTASRLLFAVTSLASGVPAGDTTLPTTTRFVTGLTLESDS